MFPFPLFRSVHLTSGGLGRDVRGVCEATLRWWFWAQNAAYKQAAMILDIWVAFCRLNCLLACKRDYGCGVAESVFAVSRIIGQLTFAQSLA